jgi:hypothetical protein
LENVNLHTFCCDLPHEDGSVSVTLPSVHAVEVIHSMAENFKLRVNDFHSHATNLCVFENPFFIEVSDTPEKLQLELTELQYDSILHTGFK